jgi:hypothetical protein
MYKHRAAPCENYPILEREMKARKKFPISNKELRITNSKIRNEKIIGGRTGRD